MPDVKEVNQFFFTCGVCISVLHANLGPLHTYPDIFENADFFLRFSPPFTRKRRFRATKTEVFESVLQSGSAIEHNKDAFRVSIENKGCKTCSKI